MFKVEIEFFECDGGVYPRVAGCDDSTGADVYYNFDHIIGTEPADFATQRALSDKLSDAISTVIDEVVSYWD